MNLQDNEINLEMLNYLNTTGPGDYDIGSLTGARIADSWKLSSPRFTLGERHPGKKHPLISKYHT